SPIKVAALARNEWLWVRNRACVWSRAARCRPDMEDHLMRVYIINADDLIVTREPPAEPGENEIVVASLDELHAARLSGKRLLALWNGLPGVDRLSKVGNREALVDRLWSALQALPDPQPPRPSKQAAVIGVLRR